MKKFKLLGFPILVSLLFVTVSAAFADEDFGEILKRAQELKDKGMYSQALNELGWAQKQLEQLHVKKLQEFFPATAGDFTRGKVEANAMMGLANVDAVYTSAAKASVKVSILGSASGSQGAQQGLGALAGFAQMAAMMNANGGAEAVRIKGQRATVEEEGSRMKLTLPLRSGSILSVEQSSGAVTKDQLVALAEAFDTQAIDNYVQAQ